MKPKYIVGISIIVIFLVFAGISLKESLTPYVPLAEAKASKATVQVKGTRVPDSEMFDVEEKIFKFKMQDTQGEEFDVVYRGVKPANFEQATEVVAIGQYINGRFEAEQLLIKCPSKYQAEGEQS